MIRWAGKRGLHVIVDEIYANSVFNPLPPPQYGGVYEGERGAFVSALRHVVGEGGDGGEAGGVIGKEWVHVVQGLSKDFGLSGFRLGWLVTGNEAVVQAWGNVGYFCSVSNDLQSAITAVLQDEVWTDEYLYSNAQLLLDAYTTVTALLDGSHPALSERVGGGEEEDGVRGRVVDAAFAIPYVPAVAGMFVWVDLRTFLPPQPEPGVNVWAWEEELFEALMDQAKVLLTPGHAQGASEPGWFRLCFAWVPKETLIVGLKRMRRVLYGRSRGDK